MKETTKGKGTQLARKTEIVRDRDRVDRDREGSGRARGAQIENM